MFSSPTPVIRSVVTLFALAASVVAIAPVQAHDESEFQLLYAPFACGTEWSATSGAHHSHPWNLDFNRTSLDYGENRQHDLGQPLFAQGDGTVVRVDVHDNAGTYVEIDYGDYTVIYVHLVHGSPPADIHDGAPVTTGQLIGLIGDTGNATGFAHLHIEYFDSRGFDDAERWELKNAGQPQTEVTFNGNPVDPYEVIVSNNCVGEAGGEPDPADDIVALTDPDTRLAQLVGRLRGSTEALDGSTDHDQYLHETETGTDVFARIPGGELADETILISTTYTSVHDCAEPEAEEPLECPGATEHAAGTVLVLDLAQALAEAETPPSRTILFAFWDEHDTPGGAAEAWYRDEANPWAADLVAIVDVGIQGSNATLPLRRTTTASTFDRSWPGLADRFTGYATPDLTVFGTGLLHGGAAGELADGDIPTISFTDLPGPCVGTAGDTTTAVDPDKLATQTAEIVAFVTDLSAGGAVGTTAPADHHTDGAALLAMVDRAGYEAAAYDALETTLALPDEPVGSTLDEAADRLLADIATEACGHHRSPAPFGDIATDSFARGDVGLLHDLAVTTGTAPTAYSPDSHVTREQMAAFLGRLWRTLHPDHDPAEVPPHPFADVDPGSYAFDDISLIAWLGITTGTTASTYAPDDPVSREQMAAFLARLLRAATAS